MAVNRRGRRTAYDNIAIASATGRERTVAGDTVSVIEIHGGGTCTSTSTGDVWHTNVAVGDVVTDQAAITVVPENTLAVATAPTDEKITLG